MKKIKDFIKGIWEGQKKFGENISAIINSILLSFVYLFGVGLTSIIAKFLGKSFLNLKLNKKETYWTNLNLAKKPIGEYYRQF